MSAPGGTRPSGGRAFAKGFGIGVAVVLVVWGICLAIGVSFSAAVVIGAIVGGLVSIGMFRRAGVGAGPPPVRR